MDKRYKILEYLKDRMVRVSKKCPDCGLWHAVIVDEKYFISDDGWLNETCSICSGKTWAVEPDTDWYEQD